MLYGSESLVSSVAQGVDPQAGVSRFHLLVGYHQTILQQPCPSSLAETHSLVPVPRRQAFNILQVQAILCNI